MKESILSDKAPIPLGQYSQAIAAEDFIFLSGQIGINPSTGRLVVGGIKEETARCLNNLQAILAKTGLTMDHVVKTTIFVTDLGLLKEVNEVYSEIFSKHPPARTTVGVNALPLGAKVEIEAIALRFKH